MFGRKAYITLEKVHTRIDGKPVWYTNGFGIVIISNNESRRLDNIRFESARDIMSMLVKAKEKKFKFLEIRVGNSTSCRFIEIPRWAYQDLTEQILRYLRG